MLAWGKDVGRLKVECLPGEYQPRSPRWSYSPRYLPFLGATAMFSGSGEDRTVVVRHCVERGLLLRMVNDRTRSYVIWED
jgi:hypothetical protein